MRTPGLPFKAEPGVSFDPPIPAVPPAGRKEKVRCQPHVRNFSPPCPPGGVRDRADVVAAVAFHIIASAVHEWLRGASLDRAEILRTLALHVREEFADIERQTINTLTKEFVVETDEPHGALSPAQSAPETMESAK